MARSRRSVSVLVVDERPLLAEALAAAVGAQRGLTTAAPVTDASRAEAEAGAALPDLILMSLDLPGVDVPSFVRTLRASAPDAEVVVLVDRESDLFVAECVEAGALGYVRAERPLEETVETLRRAGAGERLIGPDEARRLLRLLRHRRGEQGSAQERADRLTRRELEVLQLMAEGFSPAQIAGVLTMSPTTLRTHVQNVLMKLGVHSKTEALAFAIRHGKVTARSH